MYLVDIIQLIISASIGLLLAVFIARNRRAPGARSLGVLIIGASLWSMGYAFELLASNIAYKVFWEKFEYFGIVIIPIAWFAFVAQYLGNPGWMKRILQQRVLLAIIPIITLVLVWTNDIHGLVWKQVELESVGRLVTLDLVHGPWFWIFLVFSYSLILLGSVKLVVSLFGFVRLQRWQVVLVLLAILLPWIGNTIYITRLSPERYLDWTAFLFLLSGMLFTVSLLRFQLVNILPIAQKMVYDGLADCLLVLDMNDRIVDLNPVAQHMIGRPAREALGKHLGQVMPALSTWVEQACDSGQVQAEISQGEGPDQQFYELSISPLAGPYPAPIGRLVVLHEITQLKRDQAELEKARAQLEVKVSERTEQLRHAVEQLQQELVQRTLAEKRFEDVIESAPDAMLLVDPTGSIILLNARAEQLFGYSRAELLGRNIMDTLVPPQLRDAQRSYFMQFVADPSVNQTSFGLDLSAQRKDGSQFPMEIDISSLDTADGFCVAINVHDISERKRAEMALRESEQTYRVLFENAGDAIFLLGLDGNLQQVNQKAAELLGYSQQELQALTIFDITLPEEHSEVRQNFERLLQDATLLPYLRRYCTPTGEVLPTENITVLVRGDDGKPKFFQNIARDITERIKAEQAQSQLLDEIRQSNEQMRHLALRLQEVQESERREIATALHDRVGQTLTGLNLNLQILLNQMSPESNAEARNRLTDSLRMVEETTHQIRNVMADLNPPVLDEYGLEAAIKWYSGDFSTRTGITTHMTGDKLELRLSPSVEKILFRLVQESLNNIAKHARATRASIHLGCTGDAISVTVKDNGLGFDPREVNGTASQPHWGLLSMQQRAASIGAQLAIDSTPGKGTRVCVKYRRCDNDD